MPNLTPSLTPSQLYDELIRRRLARESLLDFACYTKPDYEVSWHHRALCAALDRFASGELRRLMVFMPPRHGKSEATSRRLPAYILGRNPDAEIIACSYSADLASRFNRDVQRIIDSPEYQRLFPQTTLHGANVRTVAEGTWLRNSDVFEVVGHRGFYRAAGRGQGITGMGGRFLIGDDLLKDREEADSPAVRDGLWEWYTSTFRTRLAPNGGILLTMTRWNIDDLGGRLLKLAEEDQHADQWTVLRLPAVCEEPSETDPRQPGEALWPGRYPLEELHKIRANSQYEWQALYQQRPQPAGGVEWPEDYFGPGIWFDDWPKDIVLRVLSLDPSKGRSDKTGDYSAYVMLGMDKDGMLWIDADLARRPTPKIVEDGLAICERWQPAAFAIEINAFQELLGGEFKRLAKTPLPLYGITNTAPKPVRIRQLGPWLAQRRLRFKSGSPGARLLVGQLKNFPCDAHDDGPDSLQMGVVMLNYLLGKRGQRDEPELLRV